MVWVFGPGTGELVAVRAPPDEWLLVDGCTANSQSYAQLLLDHYGATPRLILMSHPHTDHARGVAGVVERYTKTDPAKWPRLGMVPAPDTRGAGDEWDAEAALDGGIAEHAIGTILHRWSSNPACRWELELASTEPLGEATVRVLSPTDVERSAAVDAWTQRKRHDYNRAASALLITWRDRRVLLGSDLVEVPGKGWTSALEQDADLNRHDVYKLAHHGSVNAFGPQLDRSDAAPRTWIATPFAPRGLPAFGDGEAVEELIALEAPLTLTALPRPYRDQSAAAETLTRAELRDGPEREFAATAAGFPDCYACAVVPSAGPVRMVRGPGSVCVPG